MPLYLHLLGGQPKAESGALIDAQAWLAGQPASRRSSLASRAVAQQHAQPPEVVRRQHVGQRRGSRATPAARRPAARRCVVQPRADVRVVEDRARARRGRRADVTDDAPVDADVQQRRHAAARRSATGACDATRCASTAGEAAAPARSAAAAQQQRRRTWPRTRARRARSAMRDGREVDANGAAAASSPPIARAATRARDRQSARRPTCARRLGVTSASCPRAAARSRRPCPG